MHVMRTRGLDHTIRALAQIYRQIQRRFHRQAQAISSGALPRPKHQRLYDFQRQFKRKACTTYGRLFLHQLRQIHGVSMDTAAAVAAHFQTLPQLMEFIRQTDSRYSMVSLPPHRSPLLCSTKHNLL